MNQATITSIASLFTAMLVAWTAWKTSKVSAVVDTTKKTVDAVHTLSNSAMAAQLRLNAQLSASNGIMAHRLAEMTGQPGDLAAAVAIDVKTKEHEALYQAHVLQQAKVDATEAASKDKN